MRPAIAPRLWRLKRQVERGCPVCRGWGPTVLIDDDGVMLRPEWCPICGRQLPVAVWLHLVGVSLDAI